MLKFETVATFAKWQQHSQAFTLTHLSKYPLQPVTVIIIVEKPSHQIGVEERSCHINATTVCHLHPLNEVISVLAALLICVGRPHHQPPLHFSSFCLFFFSSFTDFCNLVLALAHAHCRIQSIFLDQPHWRVDVDLLFS